MTVLEAPGGAKTMPPTKDEIISSLRGALGEARNYCHPSVNSTPDANQMRANLLRRIDAALSLVTEKQQKDTP